MYPLHRLHGQRAQLLRVSHWVLCVDPNDTVDRDIHIARVDGELGRHRAIHLKLNAVLRHFIVRLSGDAEELVKAVLSEWLNLGQPLLNNLLHRQDLATDELEEAVFVHSAGRLADVVGAAEGLVREHSVCGQGLVQRDRLEDADWHLCKLRLVELREGVHHLVGWQ